MVLLAISDSRNRIIASEIIPTDYFLANGTVSDPHYVVTGSSQGLAAATSGASVAIWSSNANVTTMLYGIG